MRERRPTAAEVDLEHVRHNVRLFVDMVGPGCRVMAVVKADGYGHGDVEISRAALQAGAERLGVALVEEGEKLRRCGLDVPVHLLFEPPVDAAEEVVELGLTPTVYSREFTASLAEAAGKRGILLPVHLKVDTGMHRVGASPALVYDLAERIRSSGSLFLEGVYTHLAMASEPGHPFNREQLRLFDEVVRGLQARGHSGFMRHVAASGAAVAFPSSRMDMIRLGIAMYGLLPGKAFENMVDLRPALRLRTRICHVLRVGKGESLSYGLTHVFQRPSNVAVLPLGYGDGLARALSNRWRVKIGEGYYPLVGTVCMDLCMVDLGDDLFPVGEEVTVIGGYGEEEIGVEKMAEVLGTINYEVVCMIGKRVPRRYLHGEEESV